jgi:hypothetical protein
MMDSICTRLLRQNQSAFADAALISIHIFLRNWHATTEAKGAGGHFQARRCLLVSFAHRAPCRFCPAWPELDLTPPR